MTGDRNYLVGCQQVCSTSRSVHDESICTIDMYNKYISMHVRMYSMYNMYDMYD